MLRLVGFVLFIGGLIVTLEDSSFGSVLAVVLGVMLLFSMQPSVSTLGYGLLLYTAVDGLGNGFVGIHVLGVLLGGVLILARYGRDDRRNTGITFENDGGSSGGGDSGDGGD